MNLDQIKESWKKFDENGDKKVVNESIIQLMLQNVKNGSFSKLLYWEKLGAIIMLPSAAFVWFAPRYKFRFFPDETIFWLNIALGVYVVLCIAFFFWQLYKFKFLKSIDLTLMNITETAKKMALYAKYIHNEIIFGIIFLILYFAFYPLFFSFKSGFSLGFIIFSAIVIIFSILMMLFLYRKIYLNNINQIKKTLEEIESFEE